jgi:exopolysaccharide biosynthesis protein
MMISRILILCLLMPFHTLSGQSGTDFKGLNRNGWKSRTVYDGITLKSYTDSMFNSSQAIYIADIDTAAASFEIGVAVAQKPLVTSVFAAEENALVAINGTFFNIEAGNNVHFVRVNDSIAALTDTTEFGIRATGLFTVTGEVTDISSWGPEREDSGEVCSEDAIVSGPLLIDDNMDLPLDSTGFNAHRHPRSLVGITPDGHILFVAVDGRQPGYADGMSLFELRTLAHNFGCTDALNLDGGGSTTLVIAGEGRSGVVNKPSGMVERPVPSILFVRERLQ